jgi:hypothetical protein
MFTQALQNMKTLAEGGTLPPGAGSWGAPGRRGSGRSWKVAGRARVRQRAAAADQRQMMRWVGRRPMADWVLTDTADGQLLQPAPLRR